MVPKKGLEPPHPCGYMDLNHARLPIPPLRRVTFVAWRPSGAAFQEEQLSILQALRSLSNSWLARSAWPRQSFACLRRPSRITTRPGTREPRTIVSFKRRRFEPLESLMPNPSKIPPEIVSRLRTLAHDLSNSIETIMQASYLLSQLKLESTGAKWVTMIEDAAQDAAHINREIREVLRTQS